MMACLRLGDSVYYRSKSIKCPMCNKVAEYDFDAQNEQFEDLCRNYSLVAVFDKLKVMNCTRWKDKLSAGLLRKVESLVPKINKIKLWPEKFKK